MIDVSQQVKEALERKGKSSSDIAKWLGIGIRAAQKKLKEGSWRATELTLLSEKLDYFFNVNANSEFVYPELSGTNHHTKQPIQLNITLTGTEIDDQKISGFLSRWDELVQEFEHKN